MGGTLPILLLTLACAPSQAPFRPVAADGPGAASAESLPGDEAPGATLVLNELMASNDSVIIDERMEADDWVELYNATDAAIPLSGWNLAADERGCPGWGLPSEVSLEAGGRLLVWMDGEPEQGSLHADFSLDADGGTLALCAPGDLTPVDALSWSALGSDLVLGHFPDAGALVTQSARPTPGNANPWDPGMDLDPSDALFDPDRVLTVELWLPDESWEALEDDPYTYVEGAIGFQGVWLEPVGIRSKGQWGSYRTMDQKVALKVKLDEYDKDVRLRGLEHLTLNNMVQDPSAVHERLAYELFRDAGVPAPRTGYVALYLNGEFRGLYDNVETIDDAFLARWYDDPQGNLYEGAYGQDLGAGSYTSLTLHQQGDDDVPAYTELAALAELLSEEPAEDRVPELEALVDVDASLRMWAVEVLTGHWDGYFYYPNNYRVYHNPSTGLLSFLPWGTDQTFAWTGSLDQPAGDLAAWCLQIPSVKRRFDLALWDAADRERALGLDEDAESAWALAEPWLEADPYRETSMDDARYYYDYAIDFVHTWPDAVAAALFPDGEPEVE